MPTKVVLVLFMFQVLIYEIKNSKNVHFIERPVTDNKKFKKKNVYNDQMFYTNLGEQIKNLKKKLAATKLFILASFFFLFFVF